MNLEYLWHFLIPGYLITISIETPVLVVGLSRPHPLARRLFAGIWLTACTYPLIVLVVPVLLPQDRHPVAYLVVAEGIAHFGECVLFWAAFHAGRRITWRHRWQDYAAVFLANLCSFLGGEWLHWRGIA